MHVQIKILFISIISSNLNEDIHMEDLRPRGFSMGSKYKEIDFETFVSFKGLDIFKSNMGYFI